MRMYSQPLSLRSISNNNIVSSSKSGNMTRSQSQDISLISEIVSSHPKAAQSENALDHGSKSKAGKPQTIKEQPSVSLEDEVYSTDSSLIDEEIKKRKRKLFGFPKRNKTKRD